MNWFDTSGLTSLAKTALKEAQKTLDKALDIQDESGEEQEEEGASTSKETTVAGNTNSPQKDNSDFFSSWGLTVSAESSKSESAEQPVVTESPSKSHSQSIWGSFAGSFFEQPTSETDNAIVRPPKAKSMDVITGVRYDSQEDLFSKSQLVMSDGAEELKNQPSKNGIQKVDERRDSSRSNRLSLVSSRNSSDSVEVLSQSMKTTPDSEVASVQTISHSSKHSSSSAGQKQNSESVEILPDSLVSPSSIECLDFDSYSSDKTSTPSSSATTPGDLSHKNSTPIDRTEKPDTADSVSLVADDDDDTMSYNSISECTAPTVLDTEEKSISPFPKTMRAELQRKAIDKDVIQIEQSLMPQKMQLSGNSSNDGSWSDRTLNADNDSVTLDSAVEETKKETDPEDSLMEKLSDSSSFYNVNVTTDMVRSESSAFVNVEKQQCGTVESSESSHKESVKERTSPISSDSKSDLVKIGSDRTSGHTSGDELETATSSDIEIIPSPNGDNGHGCRSSPGKYGFKQSKFDGTTSPNLVDLVLGKSLATKIRGHNRELSEASIQSNTSDDSQGSENDRLMRRLCEMAEILEARENRLIEVSRNNAELAESNADLKSQVESLIARHEGGDINTITEDYTQRMSALEKKFQQAIREKHLDNKRSSLSQDQLRKQLDTLKESSSRKNSSELETLKERDEMISQLQEEGEKLAKQQLHHSNIIKKLRAKEKENEQVIKSLRDKIAEQTAELDRLKRSVAAKEEVEVSQIEAVYRLTTANKKLETELDETKSSLDDTEQRLESSRASLEAARREVLELQRSSAELQRRRDLSEQLTADKSALDAECEQLRRQVAQLRAELIQEEKRWMSAEARLRDELQAAREAAALGARADPAHELAAQLAAQQRAAAAREHERARTLAHLTQAHAEAEARLARVSERERGARQEAAALGARLAGAETERRAAAARAAAAAAAADDLQAQIHSKNAELETLKSEKETQISELQTRLTEIEAQLASEKEALEAEKKRNSIIQEQVTSRGDISPSHSVVSDSFSASLWHSEDGSTTPTGAGAGTSAAAVEDALWALTRREGEARALHAQLAAQRQHAARLARTAAALTARLTHYQSLQEQYDALLQMYGEKEEQLCELRLDLQDVTQLYKQQLDELVALKRRAR